MNVFLEQHTYPEIYIVKNRTSSNKIVTTRFATEAEDHVIGIVKAHSTKSFVNKVIYKWHHKWKKLIIKGYWRINDYK